MINIYKKYIEKNKKYVIIGLIFCILIIAIIIVKQFDTEEKETLDLISIEENTENTETVEEEEDYKIVIHITGEVNNEGIIEIKEGGRISDAIEEAGGLTKEADLERVNLAYELEDGQKKIGRAHV